MSKKKLKYLIPSLLTAGFVNNAISDNNSSQADEEVSYSLKDRIGKIIQNLEDKQEYNLAGHSSHQSHGSHRSHQSSSYRLPPASDNANDIIASRNLQSTPNTSILPSSQAVAKKIKTLPGNSAKFKNTIENIQTALLIKGYDVGAIDGNLHAETASAIYQYQSDNGFIPNGRVTNEVLASLAIIVE